jgi:hypothetical protein
MPIGPIMQSKPFLNAGVSYYTAINDHVGRKLPGTRFTSGGCTYLGLSEERKKRSLRLILHPNSSHFFLCWCCLLQPLVLLFNLSVGATQRHHRKMCDGPVAAVNALHNPKVGGSSRPPLPIKSTTYSRTGRDRLWQDCGRGQSDRYERLRQHKQVLLRTNFVKSSAGGYWV